MGTIAATISHFLALDQLWGFSGSLGSKVMMLVGVLGRRGSLSRDKELMMVAIGRNARPTGSCRPSMYGESSEVCCCCLGVVPVGEVTG